MSEYNNPIKQVAWEAWLKAVDNIMKGDLGLEPIHVKTAQTQFENWWELNYED
ncbi:hypothetical protein HAPG_00046 [Halorubrum phage GNf2]|nr:hypothetical protein HAPG_00046 [Halorubrum phage GNf2]